jgi:hypothetical protein
MVSDRGLSGVRVASHQRRQDGLVLAALPGALVEVMDVQAHVRLRLVAEAFDQLSRGRPDASMIVLWNRSFSAIHSSMPGWRRSAASVARRPFTSAAASLVAAWRPATPSSAARIS